MPHSLSGGIAIPSPDTVLAMLVLVAALAGSRFGWRWLACWERPLARLARHKKLAIAVAAIAPLLLRVLLLPVFAAPQPSAHDEFSFLLGADTLAHGRVVNPQHPFWVHFESIHILARPVYASAFPFAPAAALAVGRLLFGHPWAGVWLSAGLRVEADFLAEAESVRRGSDGEKRDFMAHCFARAMEKTDAWIARLQSRTDLAFEDPAYRRMWATLNSAAGLTGMPA